MAAEMTELTLDVVGAALFGHQLGDLAVELKPAVTGGLRGGEVAARLLMLAAPPRLGHPPRRRLRPPRRRVMPQPLDRCSGS